MSFKDSQSSWIWASKSGSPVSSNTASADLDMHDQADVFTFDLTSASGGNSLNPFVQSVSTPSSTSSSSSPTTSSKVNGGDSSSSENGGDESNGGAGADSASKRATAHRIVVAHGVIMSLAFLSVFTRASAVLFLTLTGSSFPSALLLSASSPSEDISGYTLACNYSHTPLP